MAPKRTAVNTTTSMTDAQIKALIDQGVADALAVRDANNSRNDDDNHDSGTGMESVFNISNCTVACQVKFATCTLQGNALTWWNSHVKTITPKVAHAIPWRILKKMMIDKYCPRGEIKKLKIEMWNLKVKGTDVVSYNQRFQELALMCNRMFPKESDKIEKYVGGFPDMIYESISTIAERQVENKRKLNNNSQAQQQPPMKQGMAIAYTAGSGERKEYTGTLPLCNKCKFHHNS
nr:hypothetical protein [Tanacetum cinerariifolium]